MSIDIQVGYGKRCTLYDRAEYRGSSGDAGAQAGRKLIGGAYVNDLTGKPDQFASLAGFLLDVRGLSGAGNSSAQVAWALQRAVASGDVVAVTETPRLASGGG